MKTMGMLTALLALFLITPAFAGEHGEGEGEDKGCGCKGQMFEELELTAEQQEAIDGLKEAMHADKTTLHEQAAALGGEMEALWAAAEIDRDAVIAKTEAVMEIKAQMHLRKLQFKLDMLELLTPEQRVKAQEHMAAKMGAGHGGHGGKGHGCKGGHGEHAKGGEPCEHHDK